MYLTRGRRAQNSGKDLAGFPWYWDIPQTTWAEKWHYADRALPPALDLFRANRQYMVRLLEAVPEAWERTITISWRGDDDEHASVAEMVESQARHGLEHIHEIETILSCEV